MFDNLRDSAFYEEQPEEFPQEPPARKKTTPRRQGDGHFLGMTAPQRFVVSLMVMFAVCLLGTLAMFVLGRMSLF